MEKKKKKIYSKIHQLIFNKQVDYHYYYNKEWTKAQKFWQLKSIKKSIYKAKI
jgi:hypothetical protein